MDFLIHHLFSKKMAALLTLVSFFFSSTPAFAANLYWVGWTSTDFGTAGNWSTTPGGAGNGTVPGVADTAIFSRESGGASAVIGAATNVQGLIMAAAFTGSIKQQQQLTIGTAGFRVGSGRFIGGNFPITLSGSYTQTGGIVNYLQNRFTLSGSLNITKGGSTSANVGGSYGNFISTGSLVLAGARATQTFYVGLNTVRTFTNLTLNNKGAAGANLVTFNSTGGLLLSGALVITQGKLDLATNSKFLSERGNITVANNSLAQLSTNSNVALSGSLAVSNASGGLIATGGTWTLNGNGNQTFNLGGGTNKLFNFTVNDTGSKGNNLITVTNPVSASGTVTVTQGLLSLSTPMSIRNNLTIGASNQANILTSGNLTISGSLAVSNASGGLVQTAGTTTLGGNGSQTFNLGGGTNKLFSFILNNTGIKGNNFLTVTNPISTSGSVTVTQGLLQLSTNTAPMSVRGSLTVGASNQANILTNTALTVSGSLAVSNASGGLVQTAGTTTFNGTAPQTVNVGGGLNKLMGVTLNNTGISGNNSVSVSSNLLAVSGALTVTQGKLDLSTQGASIRGAATVGANALAQISGNSNVALSGSLTINSAGGGLAVSGGNWTFNGGSNQTVNLGSNKLFNMTVNSPATASVIVAGTPLNLSGALTVTQGTLDLVTNSQVLDTRGMTVGANGTLTTNSNVVSSGSVTINSASTLTLTPASAWTFNGAGMQTVNMGGKRLYALTINNAGPSGANSVVIATNPLNVSGSLTVTQGKLDLITNAQPAVIRGGLTVGSNTLASFATNSNVALSGALSVNSAGGGLTVPAGTWTFNDSVTQSTTDFGGFHIYNMVLNNTGISGNNSRVISGNPLNLSGSLTVTQGKLDLNTNSISASIESGVLIGSNALAALTAGNMAVGANWTLGNLGTFTPNTGTVTLAGLNQTMTGSTTFYNLKKTPAVADTLTVQAGSLQTVNGTLTLRGASACALLSLRSTSAGATWGVNPTGARSVNNVDVKDAFNTNTTLIAAGGVDSGNNTRWTVNATTCTTTSTTTTTTSGGSGGGGGGGGGGRSYLATSGKTTTTTGNNSTTITPDTSSPPPSTPSDSLMVNVGGQDVTFHDVPLASWFATYVQAVIGAGLASGYKDANGNLTGQYGPANPVTYAEIAKMALLLAHKDVEGATGASANASAHGQWSEKYIKTAESLGFTSYGKTLDVNASATRGAVIQTILEAMGVQIEPYSGGYSDVKASTKHSGAIGTATKLGIVSGDDGKGTFRPGDPINRAEVAKILSKAMDLARL